MFITTWFKELSEMNSHKFGTLGLLIQSLSLVKMILEGLVTKK